MSSDLPYAQQAFGLFCNGNASLELKDLGRGRYIGVVHFFDHRNGKSRFTIKSTTVKEHATQHVIIAFLQKYP